MKVTLVAVISVDGKLTRHLESNIATWVSQEDHDQFVALIDKSPVIVMGSGTFEVMKSNLELSEDKLRVVLTTRPDEYDRLSVKNKLEFRNQSPEEFIKSMEKKHIQNILVAGGEKMITDFLKAGLIDEIILTIEPSIFGSGKPLVSSLPLDIKLKLVDQSTLNSNGTQLLKYRVLKP